MPATLDPPLLARASKGDLHVGMKLAVCGADVGGVEAGSPVDPLDLPCNRGGDYASWASLPGCRPSKRGSSPLDEQGPLPQLQLRYNATRPARYSAHWLLALSSLSLVELYCRSSLLVAPDCV